MSTTHQDGFSRFLSIVRYLRGPEGCPWDREQTRSSLAPHLIEEAFELSDAIRSGDTAEISEELGDLYLLATMLSVIHEERDGSSVDEVLHSAADKLVRRHPHVFGDAEAETASDVKRQWQEIKEQVEGKKQDRSALAGVSKGLPPLERAYQLQKKARKTGFDWPHAAAVLGKVREELSEVEQVMSKDDTDSSRSAESLQEELGDLLFSVVNVARFLELDPSLLLHQANEKFGHRFRAMESRLTDEGTDMGAGSVDRMNQVWNELKKENANGNRNGT
jgi:MazG family protein